MARKETSWDRYKRHKGLILKHMRLTRAAKSSPKAAAKKLKRITKMTLEVKLRECSVRELIVAMRFMRTDKDTVGFDYSKVRKDELLERAVIMAGSLTSKRREEVYAAMKKAFGWKSDTSSKTTGAATTSHGADGRSAGDGRIDPSAKGKYAHTGAPGTEQQGEGEDDDAGDGKEDGREGKGQGRQQGSQMSREQAKQATKEAIKEAAQEAVSEAMVPASEAITDEIMERLSKSVFKIEVTSNDGDGEQSEGESGEGEGEEGQQGKKKSTRTIEAAPRHEIFQEVCQASSRGLNVLLVGPAGCGKTHMAQDIAQVLGLPFKFTGAVSSEYKLLGFMTAHGQLVRTEYREAYENGGLFLWDEMDASSAQALLSFNAGLANGHQDFPDVVVRQHEKFRAIASANTYGHGADRQYVGRNQLDAASLDRFYVVNMDYDETLERALYGKDEWVHYVQSARRAMRKVGGIRHVISMRAIQMGLKMKGSGISRQKIEQACLWRHLQSDDVAKIKRAMDKAA